MSGPEVLDRYFSSAELDPFFPVDTSRAPERALVEQAPAPVQEIMKLATDAWSRGRQEGSDVWARALTLIRTSQTFEAELALSGLVYRSHEARHFIDIYSTAFGSTIVELLAQEYEYLRQLSEWPEDTEVFDRLRHLTIKRRVDWSAVHDIDDAEWPNVALRLDTPIGRFRIRSSSKDHRDTVYSIENNNTERALSINSILEFRAIELSVRYASKMLANAGASMDDISRAEELLLGTHGSPARDDYDCLRFAAAEGTNHDRTALLVASWFALQTRAIGHADGDALHHPLNRFMSAAAALTINEPTATTIEDSERRLNSWEARINQASGGSSFPASVGTAWTRVRLMADLRSSMTIRPLTGRAGQHVAWLASTARTALEERARMAGIRWLDVHGFGLEFNSSLVRPVTNPPDEPVRHAYSELLALRRMVETGASASDVARRAAPLFAASVAVPTPHSERLTMRRLDLAEHGDLLFKYPVPTQEEDVLYLARDLSSYVGNTIEHAYLRRLRERLQITVDLPLDGPEVWEVPAARAFYRRLAHLCPHLPYFFSSEPLLGACKVFFLCQLPEADLDGSTTPSDDVLLDTVSDGMSRVLEFATQLGDDDGEELVKRLLRFLPPAKAETVLATALSGVRGPTHFIPTDA
jgi:hypothetical protein